MVQWVGFLLTYILHTSHAARLGSRAGLAITLIQYGFAIRAQAEAKRNNSSSSEQGFDAADFFPDPVFASNSTGFAGTTPTQSGAEAEMEQVLVSATSEWLSLLLMTMGWFLLLVSVLGFLRIKRYERAVLSSSNGAPASSSVDSSGGMFPRTPFGGLLVDGLGLQHLMRRGHSEDEDDDAMERGVPPRRLEEEVAALQDHELFAQHLRREVGNLSSEEARAFIERERRLRNDLADAGLL